MSKSNLNYLTVAVLVSLKIPIYYFSSLVFFCFLFYDTERRLAEMADNIRERALNQMMKGRLEANPEDELKKDLDKPEFMIKAVEEWNEEEQKLAKEFEKKEQELKEQREKFKKSLETELKKHQSTINDATAAFDDKLNQLFQRKIQTEMAIFQVGFCDELINLVYEHFLTGPKIALEKSFAAVLLFMLFYCSCCFAVHAVLLFMLFYCSCCFAVHAVLLFMLFCCSCCFVVYAVFLFCCLCCFAVYAVLLFMLFCC